MAAIRRAVTLRGGLGNQLFQWALYRELASRGEEVVLDASCLRSTQFALEGLCPRPATRHSYYRRIGWRERVHLPTVYGAWRVQLERAFSFDRDLLLSCSSRTVLHGYWQTPRYWPNVESMVATEILEWAENHLSTYGREVRAAIRAERAGAIHVRRGDYGAPAARELHGLLDAEYFREERSRARSLGVKKFFVFSNDLLWCRENLGAADTSFVTPDVATGPVGEIALMAEASHHILSNSSFSWWGAWLAPGDGPVVVPSVWFLDLTMDTRDLIPASWQRSASPPQ